MLKLFRRGTVWLLVGVAGLGALAYAQTVSGGFAGFWGSNYTAAPADATRAAAPTTATTLAERARQARPAPVDARTRLVHWNRIAIDASGVDHTPIASGENRVFGEQIGPGRAARAIAIVHIAIFDAVNSIVGEWGSYTNIEAAPSGASVDAAIAQAARETLVVLFPSQAATFNAALAEDLARIPAPGKEAGRRAGRRAAQLILAKRSKDGSQHAEPRVGIEYLTKNGPGKWRQDPVSQIPVALGAFWGNVKPFVIESGRQFRVPPPPALNTRAYAVAFNEAKRLGGDGEITDTERSEDQTTAGTYWAYDGTPSLCAPPRLYNQIVIQIADQMGSDFFDLTRLLALVNVAMADAGIAIWESKYFYEFWRPVTGIREADRGTGPSGRGDGNPETTGDETYTPDGAPASNLTGPDFSPPFPAYPSGHAGFGGAIFEILRLFYGTDAVEFTFTSDEYNGVTEDSMGHIRPLHPRSFRSFSAAEEENGQSRIYLGIHWSFDKTQGIAQGRRVARHVWQAAFRPVR
jgi:hypothetical protein